LLTAVRDAVAARREWHTFLMPLGRAPDRASAAAHEFAGAANTSPTRDVHVGVAAVVKSAVAIARAGRFRVGGKESPRCGQTVLDFTERALV
jgi:hypothetical protein